VWTAAGVAASYAGKPRPVVLVQDSRFDALDSVTVCPLTTDSTSLPLFRVPITPGDGNGLREPSFAMADKVTTIPKSLLGARLGRLDASDVAALDRALVVFLGLAGGSP
jgi:mRNA interferase MazF